MEQIRIKMSEESRCKLKEIAGRLGLFQQDAADFLINDYYDNVHLKEIDSSEIIDGNRAIEAKREAIVIYLDLIHEDTLNDLADEQLGSVFRAALRHGKGEDVSASLEPMSRLVFRQVRDGIDRAWENYKFVCARNRKNGKRGGRTRKAVEVK